VICLAGPKKNMQPIKLEIRGLGHVPSFKNKKRAILDRHTGRMRTMTDAKTQKWMEQCIRSIESQLLYAIQTIAEGTLTARRVPSLIACYLPLDDSRQWLPELLIKSVDCDKGEEGATIVIEKL
jgi:hypothetical protein